MPSWFDPIKEKRAKVLYPKPIPKPPVTPPPSGGGGYSGGSGSGGTSPAVQPVPVDEKKVVTSVPEKKLSPIQSRMLAMQYIARSTTLSKREKALRMRELMTGKPTSMTRSEIKQIGKPSPSVTMTQQEYFQETSDVKRDIGKQKSEYGSMMEGIDPGLTYVYEGSHMLGSTLKAKLERDYGTSLEESEIQSQLAWQQARDLPKDTEVTKTDEGYTFKFRDTSLDWSKGEFEKIERLKSEAKKHTAKQFSDPLAGITGAVQHVGAGIAEFGFGAVSSIGALIKPIALDPLIGTPKSRASHFVSPIDVAFEPVGWSPKGSTKLMAGKPLFIAGGIAGETLQAYGMTQLMKPVSAGAKIGGKFLGKTIIKKGANIYGKFTKLFPEEKFVSGGIKGSKTIIAKGGSELPENIYRWGAKGYRTGLELTSAGVKTSSKEVPGVADDIIRNVTQKTQYGRGGVKRVWLSPEKYSKVERELAEKLGSGKVVEKGYRFNIKAGIGDVSELTEKTQFKLSVFGKRLVKKYDFTRQSWKIGDDLGLYKVSSKGDDAFKGFSRFALEGADEPITSSGWYQRVKDMYTHGYGVPGAEKLEVQTLESGTKLVTGRMFERPTQFFTGFGTSGTKPHISKWIQIYRTPFLQNVKGQASLSLQSLKTQISKPSLKLGGHASQLSKLSIKTIPSSMYLSGFDLGLDIATLGAMKTLSASKSRSLNRLSQNQRLNRETIPDFYHDVVSSLKTKTMQQQDIFNLNLQIQDQISMFKLVVPLETVTDLADDFFNFDVPSPKKPRQPSFVTIPGGGVPGFPFFPKNFGGAGGTDDMFGFTTPIYRHRKYKVKNILEEMEKGFNL